MVYFELFFASKIDKLEINSRDLLVFQVECQRLELLM
jgi:hypothetical protein